jgi:hypothetical protein
MQLYAKIDRKTLDILKYKEFTNPQLADKAGKDKWVPVLEGTKPTFDPDTHTLDKSVEVTLEGVNIIYAAVPLPPKPPTDPRIDDGSGSVSRAEMNSLKAYLREAAG